MKLKLYFLTLFIFLGLDAFWLGWVAPTFYRSRIGHLMAEEVNLLAAGFFYLIFVGGVTVFVVGPGVGGEGMRSVVLRGAWFGLVAYATYDLTNLATLRDWSMTVTMVDMLWGTVLTAATSAVSVWAGRRLL
ncbi:MAG: DUF2177 family protein [Chloroflexi bacterium]|nr:DUF2177 family protein [Chloroflexota bacterium]